MPTRRCYRSGYHSHIERREKELRLERTTGLDDEQLDELAARVTKLLPEP